MKLIISLLTLSVLFSCSTITETYEHFKTKEVKVINPYDQYRFNANEHPITSDLANVEYLKKFKALTCKKINDEQCSEKYKEMRNARYKLKYKYANIENIKEYCTGYPVECDSNEYLESIYILSNNFQVDQMEENEKAKIRAREEAETQAFLVGMGQALLKQQERQQEQAFVREQIKLMNKRTCQTNIWGNSISTECN